MKTHAFFGVRALILLALLAALSSSGCIYVAGLGATTEKLHEETVVSSPRFIEPNKIAVIGVDGFIGEGGLFSQSTTMDDLRQRLDLAAQDGSVRAVVLRINSPGGEVTASDVMYQQLRAFREKTGKPVIAHILNMGASGAYYLALAADEIVCSPTGITGSVGVIMSGANIEGLYQKLGLKPVTIKSGDKKDIGSSTRPMTEEERALLQDINRQLFGRFLDIVKERRPSMTEADLKTISDGRVVTASQALAMNMVDRIGYLEDALATAKRLADIKDADVIVYRAARHQGGVYGSAQADEARLTELLEKGLRTLAGQRGPGFYYLWMPDL